MTLVALVCLTTVLAGPVSAGTLTGATFTAPAGWSATGASNARYDWGFTTATTSTLSKVTTSVPPGTGGKDRYLALNANNSNYASTPDSTANSITGDIDVRARATPASWPPSMVRVLAAKDDYSTNQRAWRFGIHPNGALTFEWSASGSVLAGSVISAPITLSTSNPTWLRATLRVNNGSGQRILNFMTSSDEGASWNLLSSHTAGNTVVFDSSGPLSVGANDTSTTGSNSFPGKIYSAEVRNGIDGPVVNKFDPNEAAPQSPSSWTSSTGETWTITRSGTNLPADIATDLSVGSVEGLPSGGTANYRFIDGVATYNLQTPTTVNAGTNVKLNLGGFTNTATPGSYASTITTYNGATAVDNATTSALPFTSASGTSSASVAVDPSLTFTVAGEAAACRGATPTAGSSSTGNTVNLGRIDPAHPGIAIQRLSATTNATTGANVFRKSLTPLSNSNGYSLENTFGYKTAFPDSGTPAFGYNVGWYAPGEWSDASSTSAMFSLANSGSVTHCVAYKAQIGPTTPAGTYTSIVTYTAVPRY